MTGHAHHIDRYHRRRSPARRRAWREWCFWRAALNHFKWRLLVMICILVPGAILFMTLEPEKGHDFFPALYMTWSLIFAEQPEAFPTSKVLRGMFFVVPVLGLTVIIEGIVDFALMLRDRRRSERSWCLMMTASMKDHIVLVGFGRLGFRTFRLLRQLGQEVVVIERDAGSEFLDEVRHDGAPLLIGDARREAILMDAHVQSARSIILATNDDLANLEVALDARKLNPEIRVVLRMFDQNMADKVRDGFNIPIAMSQSALSAPAFAAAALEREITGSYLVGNQLVVMLRWSLREDGPLCGRTVGDILADYGFGVVECRARNGTRRLFPPPQTRLDPGDDVLVQGPLDALRPLLRRLRAPAGRA